MSRSARSAMARMAGSVGPSLQCTCQPHPPLPAVLSQMTSTPTPVSISSRRRNCQAARVRFDIALALPLAERRLRPRRRRVGLFLLDVRPKCLDEICGGHKNRAPWGIDRSPQVRGGAVDVEVGGVA